MSNIFTEKCCPLQQLGVSGCWVWLFGGKWMYERHNRWIDEQCVTTRRLRNRQLRHNVHACIHRTHWTTRTIHSLNKQIHSLRRNKTINFIQVSSHAAALTHLYFCSVGLNYSPANRADTVVCPAAAAAVAADTALGNVVIKSKLQLIN